ncbi:MAG: NnrU family protein [Myxococcota bacterium]
MLVLSIGVVLFLGTHLVPSAPGVRQRIIDRIGFNPYRGLFSLASLAGLVLIIVGKGHAPVDPLWVPRNWGFTTAVALMPLAFIFLVASYLPTNLKRVVRHPMLIGVALWAGLHLLCNGDVASLILFGGFLAFSVFDIVSANLRGAKRADTPVPWWRDLIPIVGGVLVYFVFLHYHGSLFGRTVLPYWNAVFS